MAEAEDKKVWLYGNDEFGTQADRDAAYNADIAARRTPKAKGSMRKAVSSNLTAAGGEAEKAVASGMATPAQRKTADQAKLDRRLPIMRTPAEGEGEPTPSSSGGVDLVALQKRERARILALHDSMKAKEDKK